MKETRGGKPRVVFEPKFNRSAKEEKDSEEKNGVNPIIVLLLKKERKESSRVAIFEEKNKGKKGALPFAHCYWTQEAG